MQRVLTGRVGRKILPSLMWADVFRDAFSYSFVSLPNHVSPVPYVKACVGLQPQIMSKLSFSQQDSRHTLIREMPAPGWSWEEGSVQPWGEDGT